MNEFGLFLENGDLLEEVELDLPVNEAFLLKLPPELKKLKTELKDECKAFVKDNLAELKEKNKDEKLTKKMANNFQFNKKSNSAIYGFINKVMKKHSIDVFGFRSYTVTTYQNGVPVSVTVHHDTVGLYKNYLIKVCFLHEQNSIHMYMTGPTVLYDEKDCSISKSMLIDMMNMFNADIENVKATKNSVKISPVYASAVNSALPKLEKKYGDKYEVKKNFGGFSITIKEK